MKFSLLLSFILILNSSFSQDKTSIISKRDSRGFFVGASIVNTAELSFEVLNIREVTYVGVVKEYVRKQQLFNPGLGLNIDVGYQFNPYFSTGLFGRGSVFFDDFSYIPFFRYDAGGFLGVNANRYLEFQARIGWGEELENSSYQKKGIVYGGVININFPDLSPRFDFGLRLGAYYSKYFIDDVQKNSEYITFRKGDLNSFTFDLGMFFSLN